MRRAPLTTGLLLLTASLGALASGAPDTAAVMRHRTREPPATLTILTTTIGGIGRFTYIAGPYDDDPTQVAVRTRKPGVPAEAQPERNLLLLSTNRYVIQQWPAGRSAGRWALSGVRCNGRRRRILREPLAHVPYVELKLRLGIPTVCSFVDRLIARRTA